MDREPKLADKLGDNEIQTQLNQLEKRALPFRIMSIGSIVLIVAFILSGFFFGQRMLMLGRSMFFPLLFLFLLATGSTILYNWRNNELKQFISENITSNLLESIFDVDVYDRKRFIDEERIKRMGLLRPWNRIDGSDYVKGRYKGYPVEFSDVLLEEVTTTTDAKGHTHQSTSKIFEGPMIFLSHDRALRTPLVLREVNCKMKCREG